MLSIHYKNRKKYIIYNFNYIKIGLHKENITNLKDNCIY